MTSMLFKPAPPPRGKAISVYLPARAHRLLKPWAGGRQRSARLAAILDRYDTMAHRRPALDIHEWAVVVQLLPALAGVRDIGALWAELLDRAREGERLLGVDPDQLARKLRQLVPAEQVAVLEVADQVAAAGGPLRERLAVAGVEG
jgi:hypothetical protein